MNLTILYSYFFLFQLHDNDIKFLNLHIAENVHFVNRFKFYF